MAFLHQIRYAGLFIQQLFIGFILNTVLLLQTWTFSSGICISHSTNIVSMSEFYLNSFKIIFFSISLPWNRNTVLGYALEIIFNASSGSSYFIATGFGLIFFVSMCFLHRAFAKCLRYTLSKLDHIDKSCNQKELVHDVIRFHNEVKK